MKAEIIAVGTELLLGHVVNSNSAEIARMLAEIGIGVYHQVVVGDNAERLGRALKDAMRRADLVITSGGLGPTTDDLTRETLAEVLGLPLLCDPGWAAHLQDLFERRYRNRTGATDAGGSMPANNLRQAMVPDGAMLLPNSRGSAPGILLNHDGVTFVLLPGPPKEMRGLMKDEVLPRLGRMLQASGHGAVLLSRVLRVIGIGESRVAELLESLLAGQTNPTIAPLAHPGEMHLRITAHAPDRGTARHMNDTIARGIYAVLGDAVYGEDDDSLERVTGALLDGRGLTLALAESCTGGLVAHRLTNVPGSSAYFQGGIVAYSNELKQSVLGVDPELILQNGAVSAGVAESMARGARNVCRSDLALAITGIAGPGGGTDEKPVGLVFMALAEGGTVHVQRHLFSGSREEIKMQASQTALELLRRHLLGH